MWQNLELTYVWPLYLILLPVVWYFLLPAFRFRSTAINYPDFEQGLAYTNNRRQKKALVKKRSWLGSLINLCLWGLLLVAAAQPVRVGQPELQIKTTRNFLLICDISFSMAQKDWVLDGHKVRRWDAVKEVMHQFIMDRQGDRMGLVFFGSSAYIQSPFTTDLMIVDTLLEQADVGMAGQMTNIGKAIVKGITMFETDTMKTKVILLLTDGVDSGQEILPLDAAALAKEDTISIYTLGIGNALGGATDLDEETLKEIANFTDGKYFKADDMNDLQNVYDAIDKLEPIAFEEKKYIPKTPLYYYPLLMALGLWCVVLWVTWGARLLGKTDKI